MFTGGDTLCPLVEVNEIMTQAMEMGEFGKIDNPGYLMKASPLIEHIFISAFPPHKQDQIRTATLQEVKGGPEVLWDARRRFTPGFSTEQDENDICINYKPFDGNLDADATFAQRLQDSINEKDSVIYSKRKLQMQEDAEYAKSLVAAEAGNNRVARATQLHQQQMSSINDREHLQNMLDMTTPLQVIGNSEEDVDDQPMRLDQLEELEEVIHGRPYVPDHYEDNIYSHGPAPQYPERSPAEMHDEDSE